MKKREFLVKVILVLLSPIIFIVAAIVGICEFVIDMRTERRFRK